MTGASAEELSGVLKHFEAFLASSGGTPFEEGSTIDITHEALIRQWVKLKGSKEVRGWATEEAEAAKVYTRLAEVARRDAASWRDPDLTEALELQKTVWSETWAPRYTPEEGAYRRAEGFLDKSRRHRFYSRVRTWGLIGLVVLVVAAAFFIQVEQRRQEAALALRDAEIERIRTQADAKAAEADRLGAEANQAGADRERLLAEAERLSRESASLEESTQNYETVSQKLKAELAELRSLRADVEGELQLTQARAAELTKGLSATEEQNANLAKEKDALSARLSAAETAQAGLKTRLKNTAAELESLKNQAAGPGDRRTSEHAIQFSFKTASGLLSNSFPTTDEAITVIFADESGETGPGPRFHSILEDFTFPGKDIEAGEAGTFTRKVSNLEFMKAPYIRVVVYGSNGWNGEWISLQVNGQVVLDQQSLRPRKHKDSGLQNYNLDKWDSRSYWEEEFQTIRLQDEHGFYTDPGLDRLLAKSGRLQRGEFVRDKLLLFETPKQHTWLITTDRHLWCLLDDSNTRTKRVVQWSQPLNKARNIRAYRSSKGTPVIELGAKNPWIYSVNLHPDPNTLAQQVRILIERSTLHRDDPEAPAK